MYCLPGPRRRRWRGCAFVENGYKDRPPARRSSESLMSEEGQDELRAVRLAKAAELRRLGVDPYPYAFTVTATAAELLARYQDLAPGQETPDQVAVAGRIRAYRNSGMFIDLHDAGGKIQIFCHKDFLAPEQLAVVKLLDIGEII